MQWVVLLSQVGKLTILPGAPGFEVPLLTNLQGSLTVTVPQSTDQVGGGTY
jgi:hypothetical protein